MTREEIDGVAFPGRSRLGRVLEHVRDELLAGREAPLAGAEDGEWAAGAVAELLRGALAGEDEGCAEKEGFYARVAAFGEAAAAAV